MDYREGEPMSYKFDEELDELEKNEGGRGLRRKLEDTLASNKSMASELSQLRAEKVIAAEGLSLVKPEDLAGVVDPDKILKKAKALQEERLSQQKELAKDLLARRGLEGDELEAAVADLVGPAVTSEEQVAETGFGRLNETIRAGGTPTPVVNPNDLHGVAAIEAGLAARERRSSRNR